MESIKILPSYLRFVIFILASCFAIGTLTHSFDIYRLGFFGYSKLPHVTIGLNIFWTLLIFLDPLTIILLFFRRKYGVILGFLVLLFDVIVNMNFILKYSSPPSFDFPSFVLQFASLLFSLFTLPLWLGYLYGNCLKLYRDSFAFVPIVSFFFWFLFHVTGSINLFTGTSSQTLWIMWSQFSMLALYGFIVIALFNKTRIGFYMAFIALVALTGEIIVCATLAMFNVITMPVKIGAGVRLAMSLLSISSLIMTKDRYLKISKTKQT